MSEQDINRKFEDLKHQVELLENKGVADMRISQAERREAKAESDSAIERLRVSMAEQFKDVIKVIATMSGIIVVSLSVILGGLIALLQYFK